MSEIPICPLHKTPLEPSGTYRLVCKSTIKINKNNKRCPHVQYSPSKHSKD